MTEADRDSKLADVRGRSTVCREVDVLVGLYLTRDIYDYAELQTKPLQRGPHCPLLRLLVAGVMQEGTGDSRGPEQFQGPWPILSISKGFWSPANS